MKAERRHELQENELAHVIAKGSEYLRANGRKLGYGVLAVLGVILVVTFTARHSALAREDQWRRLTQLKFDAKNDLKGARDSLNALGGLTGESKDENFLLYGLMVQASHALQISQQSGPVPDRAALDTARSALERLLARFGDNVLAVGYAHCGLATVEENMFVLTGDAGYRSKAEEHLSALINNHLMDGTPFQKMAIDRRNAIDTTFTDVRFAPADPTKAAEAKNVGTVTPLPAEILEKMSPEDRMKFVRSKAEYDKLKAEVEGQKGDAAQPDAAAPADQADSSQTNEEADLPEDPDDKE